jgi:4-amino-4-deoxy-L-arabinose transferase-like glycosyltransferase
MQPATRRWLLVAVLVGAALRFVPIWFGLPYPQARPDEETALAKALDVAAGELNPRFFHWPSLTFYVFGAALWLAQAVAGLAGDPRPLTFSEHALVARAVVALAGTLTIPALFWLARRDAGERTATLAAALLAVAILHVRDSHFAMTDVLMTLLVVVSLGCLVRAVGETEYAAARWCAAAGLAGGLAVSTKYSAGAVLAGMAAVQILRVARARRQGARASVRPFVLFCLAAVAGFVVATPYAVLDRATFVRDVLYDVGHLAAGHGAIDLGRGWSYHLTHTLPYGVGLGVFAAAAAGIVPMLRRYAALGMVTGAFALAFYLAIGSGQTVFFRYVLPVVPVVCLFAAAGIVYVADLAARTFGLSARRALAGLVILIVGPALVQSVRLDALLARTDTRVLAGAWLEPRLSPAASVHDAGSPYTRLNMWRRPFERWEYDPAAGRFAGRGAELPEWLVLYESPLRAYTVVPPELWALARERYALAMSWQPVREEGGGALYDQQDAFFAPIAGFSAIERPGPTIYIYRRLEPPR